MMQAMVDHVTGMVYWVPVADQSATGPIPAIAPFVVQSPYRLLRPVLPPQTPVLSPVVAPPAPLEPNTTVFVRGIPREATTQSVESFFHIYGEILSCHVIRHKDASTNKGIAFVKFRSADAAQRAISCNHPGVMEQREIFAEWAHPRPPVQVATTIRGGMPDQQMMVNPSGSAPHVYMATPPAAPLPQPQHPPRFLPVGGVAAAQPWMVGGLGASSYHGSQYLGVGGHVLGFPAHAGFSGHESFGFTNYPSPVAAEYYHGVVNVSAISTTSASPRAGSSTRNESDGAGGEDSEREGGDEASHYSSITRLHLGDSERAIKSRKGKEKET